MKLVLPGLRRNIGSMCMNHVPDYGEQYFFRNHFRHLNSWYAFLVKLYYRHVANVCMAKVAALDENARVLDVGCGVGILVEQFRTLRYDALGVDVSEQAIANSLCHESCRVVECSSKLDFPDDHFDLIVSREVLEHIRVEDIDRCIDEWDRVGKGLMIHIIAVSERGASALDDPTHVNVKSESWWIEKFEQKGYAVTLNPSRLFFSPFGSRGYMLMEKRTPG